MKKGLKLLDCTLRDGGYVNAWRFGNLTIRSVVLRLDNAGVDIIECGFLDSRCTYDKDRSIYPDIPSIAKTLAHSLPRRAMLVAMIDFGTFDEALLIPQIKSVLDGIRLIFKKEDAEAALEYGAKIKTLGYKLFLNPVAFTSYRDEEILSLVRNINKIQPFGMSIVDTYGLMLQDDIGKYIRMLDENLDPDIALGYHTHNNLQMGNAHCISYINRELLRPKVLDSSILGMGKNAGNACTELLCSYLDKTGLGSIDLDQIFECAYVDIARFNSSQNWGYGLDTLLSAIHDCSPNWVKFLMGKNTLSIEGIRRILDSLPFEKREVSFFRKELAEQIYLDFLSNSVDDADAKTALSSLLYGRDLLVLCPGRTLKTHRNAIDSFIGANSPLIITVNFVTDAFGNSHSFISNSIRYSQMLGVYPSLKEKPKVHITSNIVSNTHMMPESVFDYKSLSEQVGGDGGAALLIALLGNLGVRSVAVAGLDGFDEGDSKGGEGNSFYDDSMQLVLSSNVNNKTLTELRSATAKWPNMIKWLTPSKIKEML